MSAKANFKEAVGQFYDKWAEHYDEVSQLWIPRVHPLNRGRKQTVGLSCGYWPGPGAKITGLLLELCRFIPLSSPVTRDSCYGR